MSAADSNRDRDAADLAAALQLSVGSLGPAAVAGPPERSDTAAGGGAGAASGTDGGLSAFVSGGCEGSARPMVGDASVGAPEARDGAPADADDGIDDEDLLAAIQLSLSG